MKKQKRFSCDFETTTELDDCRVWLWAITEIGNEENIQYGYDIKSFIEYIQTMGDVTLFFHNLAFDCQFILYYLLTNGYSYTNSTKYMKKDTFNTLITDTGIFYMITIRFEKNRITIYDSMKKIPSSVKKIAKDWKLEEKKGSIDYRGKREIGYIATDEEIDYIKNDVVIVSKALQTLFDNNMSHMTIASDALHNFQGIHKDFRKLFPVLTIEEDNFIRHAYRGGFTWTNPELAEKDLENLDSYDVNSLYPSVMYQCSTPIGKPQYFTGKYQEDEAFPLYIIHFIAMFHLKENCIPMIQIKKNKFFVGTQYQTEVNIPTELYLTSVDFALFQDMYEIDYIEYIDGYKFQEKEGVFQPYIDYWIKVKIENDPKANPNANPSLRAISKLMLNSLYGKFASSTSNISKIPYYDKEKDVVRYENGEPEEKEPIYTAAACFITANSRNKTIRTAMQLMRGHHKDNNGKEYYLKEHLFAYADTDSIHILHYDGVENLIDVDDTRLGAWKHENDTPITRARYLRAKTYVEEMEITKEKYLQIKEANPDNQNVYQIDDKYYQLNVKCAGMPDNVKMEVNFDNFQYGFESTKKLKPVRTSGGVVLIDTPFKLRK